VADSALRSNPPVLAGPILRRLEPQRLVLWLVASRRLALTLKLFENGADGPSRQWSAQQLPCRVVPLGRQAFLHLIDLHLEAPLAEAALIGYDLCLPDGTGIADWASHLLYAGERHPTFVVHSERRQLLYGSCRKPHHPSRDGLTRADALIAERPTDPQARPALLLLTGDQIYADDVSAPMLCAVQALIKQLGLPGEPLEGAVVRHSDELYRHPDNHHRQRLLPALKVNRALRERFFGGVKKPIFTTDSARRHLVTFSEVLAMYLLVWSPLPWRLIDPAPMVGADDDQRIDAQNQQRIIDGFVADLPAAARVLAHLPTVMMFDDHDVTDDWNLTAAWEATAYGHPFSRRIIGNALIGYLLCQGWGNQPEAFEEPLDDLVTLLEEGADGDLQAAPHDALIDRLLTFERWHFSLPGSPKIVVLNTRTRRWRSERSPSRPSGLMDWEALTELQQELLNQPAAVIVSPAPIFGVKLIETVQKLFSLAGKPLTVDAENWMAHRGAARVILNIFRHSRTPANYVVLSGDVHYSFVYRVRIRQRQHGPRIWQLTDSGLKNRFPDRLLSWFDRLNRWLYAPWSPLNGFTKRRRLAVTPYLPEPRDAGERLWNGAGIGLVTLDAKGRPERIEHLNSDGTTVCFKPRDAD
tara:strand:+ start:3939 stop:5858 length:1920 start_codon:yes stop_codon:yes gene_type:complete